MSMTDFDPDAFMASSTDEANAEHFDPIPEGEYPAIVKKVEVGQFQGKKDPSKTYTSMNVTWVIDAPQIAESLGREELTSRQSVFLDINDSGNLDTGPNKNVGLGKLRAAVGQNQPGKPWSPAMLEGAGPCMVKVEHVIRDEDTFDNVTRVAKL
jgi:hypothetical protein